MNQYLIAIHRPNDYDPSAAEDDEMRGEIDALNDEMVEADVRVFVGGLKPIDCAKSIRVQPDGKFCVTDEAYVQTSEHVGGFWVLEVADESEALDWGRKAAVACRASVEVRPFH
ncbi:hypothetical protein NT6N_12330 [Oceaniferula spumae]|uniref:YCII-related domain-containing protein n=1 Tax=Oceaniferula spumae TaxID=2979115 RepID=A0AAT9FJP7_9BACT